MTEESNRNPTISFSNGAAPEIIEDGISGYLVNNVDEMVIRIGDIQKINRKACRERIEIKFTIEKW